MTSPFSAEMGGRRVIAQSHAFAASRWYSRLAQLLVSFTIEFDNEFEHRMPHRTAASGPADRGPWLVSMAMWSNCLRYVQPKGIPVSDVAGLTNLGGLERWRYITVAPDPADQRPKPPRSEWLVRPTSQGLQAQQVWIPLAAEIEQRWGERFGAGDLDRLRASLRSIVDELDVQLPRYLPVVNFGNGWMAERPELHRSPPAGLTADDPDLAELLSRVLLAATLEFERDAELSLPVCLNALRVLGADPVEVRQLSALVGVSKEAAAGMVGSLERAGFLVNEHNPAGGRGKVLRLTAKGEQASTTHAKRLDRVDDRWRRRFGEQLTLVEDLVAQWFIRRPGEPATVALGLRPYPDGWRASKIYASQTERVLDDPGANLPRYPMVLHRGGYPDGS